MRMQPCEQSWADDDLARASSSYANGFSEGWISELHFAFHPLKHTKGIPDSLSLRIHDTWS